MNVPVRVDVDSRWIPYLGEDVSVEIRKILEEYFSENNKHVTYSQTVYWYVNHYMVDVLKSLGVRNQPRFVRWLLDENVGDTYIPDPSLPVEIRRGPMSIYLNKDRAILANLLLTDTDTTVNQVINRLALKYAKSKGVLINEES